MSIVTLTLNPTVDKSSTVDTVASEIKLRCDPPTFDPGGGGINVSRAVHKLGGHSTAVYTKGGGAGDMLAQLLDKEGITQDAMSVSGFTRENLTVFERTTGLQYRFGMPGPELSEEEWQDTIDHTLAVDAMYVVASGSLPPNVPDNYYATLAQRVNSEGKCFVVDTSGDALKACFGADVYLLKPNLYELELLSGEKFEGEDQLKSATQRLIAEGLAKVMIVSLGSAGAALITADDFVQYRPPAVPIQSKVGAGDSMVGGVVKRLSESDDEPTSDDLRDAARWGVAAGTAAVMTPETDLCRAEDAQMVYDKVTIIER